MTTLNRAFGALLNGALSPLDRVSPVAGVSATAIVVGILMLLTFRATSDQKRIATTKRLMQASIFEMRLFNDDPRGILHAQAGVLRHTLTYIRLSAVPLLWMILPLTILTAHLQARYGYDGLRIGESALVTVAVGPESEAQGPSVTLVAPPGVRVETPLLWIPSRREAGWRISAERDGEYVLNVAAASRTYSKTLVVSRAVVPRSPVRPEAGILHQLIWPAEDPLPVDATLESIAVSYPAHYLTIFGCDVHWLVAFFAISLAVAFAAKGRFGVTF